MPSMTHDEFRALRHFSGLDGLRAVAAVMVVAFHFGGQKWEWLSGWSGVQLFFVLSGFLITTLALREEQRHGRVSKVDFYLRRFFRIVPLYLVVVALYFGPVFAAGGEHGRALVKDLPYLLTFTNEYAPSLMNWAPHLSFIQSWTLGIEQKFYLLWPLVAFTGGLVAFSAVRRIGMTLGVMALVLLGSFVVLEPIPHVHYMAILWGCLLAIGMHDRRGYALVRPLTRPAVGVVIGALFCVVQVGLIPLQEWVGHPTAVIIYGFCVMLLLPAVLGHGPVRWALSVPPMRFGGERSYGIYLVQGLAGWAIAQVVTIPAGHRMFLVATLVAVLFADILYRTVEQPFIRLGRVVVARRQQAGSRLSTSSSAEAPAESSTVR